MQELAWYVTLVVVVLIAAVFVRVVLLSRQAQAHEGVQGNAYLMRSWLFWALIVLGVLVAWASLRLMPYVRGETAADVQVVEVESGQWWWALDPDTVVAGQPVEFRVTSDDVNHGFGIYDEQTRLVAQVQAMPGYVNRLQYTFETPGIYRIMCLEYCGTQHHEMIEELEVTDPADVPEDEGEDGDAASGETDS